VVFFAAFFATALRPPAADFRATFFRAGAFAVFRVAARFVRVDLLRADLLLLALLRVDFLAPLLARRFPGRPLIWGLLPRMLARATPRDFRMFLLFHTRRENANRLIAPRGHFLP
jgi:hypothetical protein